MNSKLHAVCDGQSWPVGLYLTAGQVSDFKGADVLLADLPEGAEEVTDDRGYDSNRLRHSLARAGYNRLYSAEEKQKRKARLQPAPL
ncbi:transposase [Acetobacter oeni]|uniref:transposase n=1 Tax=Acetobacter oeni TaxID=304077 RepID=UPI0018E92078